MGVVAVIKSICSLLLKQGEKIKLGFKRFPETFILAAVSACIAIYLNHHVYEKELIRYSLVLVIGCPIFLSIRVFLERNPEVKRHAIAGLYILSIAGLTACYLMLQEQNYVSMTRYFVLNSFFYVLFTVIPYYRREKYELYLVNLTLQCFIAVLYAIILFAGLSFIVVTLKLLFSMDVTWKWFADIWCVTAVFGFVCFCAGVPKPEAEMQLEGYPRFLRILMIYIALPLAITYMVILYIYFMKILINTQWPEGMVANLVVWYSIVCAGLLFCIWPLREFIPWIEKLIRYFSRGLIPLLVMMFIAIGIRINAYGVTESRYYVVLLGIYLAVYMIYLGISRKPENLLAVILVAVISLFSLWGPWSSFNVAIQSQNNRLEKILIDNGMLDNGTIKANPALSLQTIAEIRSKVMYFMRYHSLNDIKYVPRGFQPGQMKEVFGFAMYGNVGSASAELYKLASQPILHIKGYDYLIEVEPYVSKVSDPNSPYSVNITNGKLSINRKDKVIYENNIRDIAYKIYEIHKGVNNLTQNEMTYIDGNESVEVKFIFKEFSCTKERVVFTPAFYLFIKTK
ncbi:Hypothetical protein LUCI_2380 [Lucifera butyrica]|uniref:DUF4153 domain-containing protein n=1 Tax=Lucifera butyrica TaxID=1351585 RepID=A0A498R3B0_9FIRM|nr:DUF4153 domain-containing protein [Lucifera butyrica]VBB07136.1 Hypothetical protein LUCI_2380 [Lucifera butyrica]